MAKPTAGTAPAEKLALARQLSAAAANSRHPDEPFVLLDKAMQLAGAAGDAVAHDGGDLSLSGGGDHGVVAKDAAKVVLVRKDVFLTLEISAEKIDGKYFFLNDIPILVNQAIPINTPTVSIYPVVTKFLTY